MNDVSGPPALCPFFAQFQTSDTAIATAEKCHHAASRAVSFHHLVGKLLKVHRHIETEPPIERKQRRRVL
jgi:hypothetical protein